MARSIAADYMDEFHPRHMCSNCGCAAEQHKADTGTCPATLGWGHQKKFPTFRPLLRARGPEAVEKAGKILDKKLARYWISKNRFHPVR
jgi:hypothetical protein